MPERPSRRFHVDLGDDLKMDLVEIGHWSKKEFGKSAATRYRSLIRQALRDVSEDPLQPGSKARPDLYPEGLRTYHLSFSRFRVPGPNVKSPRHLLIYRITGPQTIEILRIVHDSRDLVRHIPRD